MNSFYKTINKVQTHLLTWGNPFDCNGQDVILCITGNPGITNFYIEFGSYLHEHTSLPVCIIGHAGHEELPNGQCYKLKGQEHLYNLRGQVEHKLDLIKNYIDKNSKVHIIGHSIGSWMIIELMHKNDFMQERVSTTHLLFPTIQKMAQSANGIYLNKFVRPLNSIILFFLFLLLLLPEFVLTILINCYLKYHGYPRNYFNIIRNFLNPRVIEKVLFLAYDEMDTVVELNTEGIKKLSNKTKVIYNSKDKWVMLHYMEDLKNTKPSIEMKHVDISHAFVLKSSERIANMVSDYIKSDDRK